MRIYFYSPFILTLLLFILYCRDMVEDDESKRKSTLRIYFYSPFIHTLLFLIPYCPNMVDDDQSKDKTNFEDVDEWKCTRQRLQQMFSLYFPSVSSCFSSRFVPCPNMVEYDQSKRKSTLRIYFYSPFIRRLSLTRRLIGIFSFLIPYCRDMVKDDQSKDKSLDEDNDKQAMFFKMQRVNHASNLDKDDDKQAERWVHFNCCLD